MKEDLLYRLGRAIDRSSGPTLDLLMARVEDAIEDASSHGRVGLRGVLEHLAVDMILFRFITGRPSSTEIMLADQGAELPSDWWRTSDAKTILIDAIYEKANVYDLIGLLATLKQEGRETGDIL
jgi:hypothetical protein